MSSRFALALLVAASALGAAPSVSAKTTAGPTLELRSSERIPPGARDLGSRPTPPPIEPGLYVGPIFVEGPLADRLRRLPLKLRRSLSSRVGPMPLTFDQGNVPSLSFGLGAYLRF